jgi:tetratricopeptide (TPR) repeat protein
LRAALRWSVERAEVERAIRLGAALWDFWLTRAFLTEGRERLMQVLQLAESHIGSGSRSAALADALNGAGFLATRQSDHAAARSLFERSLEMSRELGDRPAIADSLNYLGVLADDQGDYVLAQSLHEESLAIRRELDEAGGIAASLNNLGAVIEHRAIVDWLNHRGTEAEHQAEFARARSLLEQGLAIRRQLKDQLGIAGSLMNLGFVADYQGDYATARGMFEESLRISQELGNRDSIDWSLEGFSALAAAQGQAERALRLDGAATRLREDLGTPLPAVEAELFEKRLSSVRQLLSKEAAAAAWAEGHAMKLEEAIACALEQSSSTPATGRGLA